MYDSQYFFVANPINRYSISPRQNLKANADGSIDLYIQGRGYVSKGRLRILAKIDDLPHWPAGTLHVRNIGGDPARHFHGYKGIAVDVGIRGEPEVLKSFNE